MTKTNLEAALRRDLNQLKRLIIEDRKWLESIKPAVTHPLALDDIQVSISIVRRHTQMAELNDKFRGKNVSTDVLSFPAAPFFQRQGQLGDIVICLPVARVQAKKMRHSLRKELRILLVHGLCHLMGFDHEKSSVSALKMLAAEESLLSKAFAQPGGLIYRESSGKLLDSSRKIKASARNKGKTKKK